jgi:hypothetical protein
MLSKQSLSDLIMSGPRTMREAFAVQALEEVDALLLRVETIDAKVSSTESSLEATTKALLDAADKFRMAVTAFTEDAKADLTEHIQRKGAEQIKATIEEQHSAMQEAARLAFRSQASDDAGKLAKTLREAAGEFKRASWSRMGENLAVAVIASAITSGVIVLLLHLPAS